MLQESFCLIFKLREIEIAKNIPLFPCLFNQRTRFKTQFHDILSLVEKTLQTANKPGRAERKLLHVKMSSGATYSVSRCTRPRAIPLALTKIFRIDGLPNFLTYGAPRAFGAELRY